MPRGVRSLRRDSFKQVLRLSLVELLRERDRSAVLLLLITTMLVPSLVLLGLRTGYIETEQNKIETDPKGLGLFPGNFDTRYDSQWIDRMRNQPQVRFLGPKLSFLSARVKMVSGSQPPNEVEVQMLSTGLGDPVLEGAVVPAGLNEIALSHNAARKLDLSIGDEAELILEGMYSRKRETQRLHRLPVTVVAVLPEYREDDTVAFASLKLLHLLDDFLEGRSISELGLEGREPPQQERLYRGWRMYAKTIDDVLPLRDRLEEEGLIVVSNADRIEDLLRMRRVLDTGVLVVLLVSLTGATASLGAVFWQAVERKRHTLSVLLLYGLPQRFCALIPLVQSLLVTLASLALSLAVFSAFASVLPLIAGAANAVECILKPQHMLVFGMAVLILSALASLFAAYRINSMEPSEGLRVV